MCDWQFTAQCLYPSRDGSVGTLKLFLVLHSQCCAVSYCVLGSSTYNNDLALVRRYAPELSICGGGDNDHYSYSECYGVRPTGCG